MCDVTSVTHRRGDALVVFVRDIPNGIKVGQRTVAQTVFGEQIAVLVTRGVRCEEFGVWNLGQIGNQEESARRLLRLPSLKKTKSI